MSFKTDKKHIHRALHWVGREQDKGGRRGKRSKLPLSGPVCVSATEPAWNEGGL